MRLVRLFLFVLMLCGGLICKGQLPQYIYKLDVSPENHLITGSVTINIPENFHPSNDTVLLHLPSGALSDKNSFFRNQLLEYQKVDLHFAKQKDYGFILFSEATLNNNQLEICSNCEFAKIPVTTESNQIELNFTITLPSKNYLGTYTDNQHFSLIDWLPRLAYFSDHIYQPLPYTFYHDHPYNQSVIDLDVTLPQKFIVASNLQLTTKSELEKLNTLKADPYAGQNLPQGLKTLNFADTSSRIQLHASSRFKVFEIDSSKTLYYAGESLTLPLEIPLAIERTQKFFEKETGKQITPYHNVVVVDQKGFEYQSAGMITLNNPRSGIPRQVEALLKTFAISDDDGFFKLESAIVQASAEAQFRYLPNLNTYQNIWMARGIPYFYKYLYAQEMYPDKKWIKYADSWLGKIFALDDFKYGAQNQVLHDYLVRQNLDQPIETPANELNRLNYEAMPHAKFYLSFYHLRNYLGDRNFKRGMNRFLEQNSEEPDYKTQLEKAFNYYSFKNTSWFFDTLLVSHQRLDYALTDIDHCPTVTTATIKNTQDLNVPYSLTGYKNGKPILTEWHEGHSGKKTVQMYNDDYEKVILNNHFYAPELSARNNRFKNRLLFPKAEPLRFQLYNTFENPNYTQVYFIPFVDYNAYDQILVGGSFYNGSLVQRPFEYALNPSISTGTGKLTGSTKLEFNILTSKSAIFRQIRIANYTRYNHYNDGLAYFRLSPSATFYFQKPSPRSPLIRSLRLRTVTVDRELENNFEGPANGFNAASYTVSEVRYKHEYTNILRPFTLIASAEYSPDFTRFSASADWRFMLPNKKWFIWRSFGGVFVHNAFADKGLNDNYYAMGLSGTLDYLFDYNFIGRSDSTGIWSQQMFTTDGGFKSATNVFANRYMLSTNVSIPLYKVFGVFADAGVADNFNKLYWDCGFRVALLTDFLEFYFPIANHNGSMLTNDYGNNVRFVLEADLGTIVNRLRRGFY